MVTPLVTRSPRPQPLASAEEQGGHQLERDGEEVEGGVELPTEALEHDDRHHEVGEVGLHLRSDHARDARGFVKEGQWRRAGMRVAARLQLQQPTTI